MRKAVERPEFSSLDRYLQKAGFHLSPKHSEKNEGYVTAAQKRQFISWLQSKPSIKRIVEIGLNGGHSAEIFFEHCPNLERFISFDIEMHGYTKVAKKYFMKRYRSQFLFISGDSQVKVPEYALGSVHPKCDLIYIDGDHSYESSLKDIMNCRLLAHENSILWIDDCHAPTVHAALLECEENGVIRVDEMHNSSDPCGNRSWVVAHYV
jgi:predicted O-methyltransferase YrrM